jgi:hypothetical protein
MNDRKNDRKMFRVWTGPRVVKKFTAVIYSEP